MKNLTVLRTPSEIEHFLHNLWATDLFKQAHQTSPYLRHWIQLFTAHPRFFGEMTEAHAERANFTPWFNLILHRHYPNPYVQDLYYLHELIHAVTLTYAPQTWALWREKMFDNEMLTSLETEVNVYQQLPGLRPHTFPQAIWADTVLQSGPKTMAELISLRKHATLNPQTPAEQLIRSYAENNEQWAKIWETNFGVVEKMMVEFYNTLSTDPELAINRYQQQLAAVTTNGIPFEAEARAFAKIYWKK